MSRAAKPTTFHRSEPRRFPRPRWEGGVRFGSRSLASFAGAPLRSRTLRRRGFHRGVVVRGIPLPGLLAPRGRSPRGPQATLPPAFPRTRSSPNQWSTRSSAEEDPART